MIVAITGGTGFIGTRLIRRIIGDGHRVRTLDRRPSSVPGVEWTKWDPGSGDAPAEALDGADAVVNLAGEPVAQRWNSEVKARIRESRIAGTRRLVTALERLPAPPRVLLSASAIGFYGDRGDEVLTETSASGRDFLSQVCVDWEAEALRAANLGVRVVLSRTGIVLGTEGGALKQMIGPFKAGVGGPVGSGKHWVSWIHIDDAVELLWFVLTQQQFDGPVNAVAPNPVRNKAFAHALGTSLGRPSAVPVPAFALKLMFGEAAEAILSSQRVQPEAAVRAGFRFRYPELDAALKHLLG